MNPGNEIYYDLFFVAIAVLAYFNYAGSSYSTTEKYLTFGPRFWAGGIDGTVLSPFMYMIQFILLYQLPLIITLPVWFVSSFLYTAYSIVLHAKYGQTVGKWICKVKVVNAGTETKIGWRQALLRDSVPLLFTVALSVYELTFIFGSKLSMADLYNPEYVKKTYETSFGSIVVWTSMLWFLAELITMLTNKKRRAIHDFIAGTVVVRTNIEEEEQLDQDFEPARAASQSAGPQIHNVA